MVINITITLTECNLLELRGGPSAMYRDKLVTLYNGNLQPDQGVQ